MVDRSLVCATLASLALACSHSIPPPSSAVSRAPDAHTAKENPANVDPNLNPPFGPFDLQTVFYISKSNDKDHVDYGMRLDQHCSPPGDDSVFPYWRELAHPPPVRSHPLKFLQYAAYGFAEQRALKKSVTGGQYRVTLKQVDRPILVVTGQDASGHCAAQAYTTIRGVKDARLDHIFVQVAGLMSADYIDVYGTDPKTGQTLVERLRP